MAFCRKCGAPLGEGDAQCPGCSFEARDETPSAGDDQHEPTPASAPSPKARRPVALIVAIVVMVVVAAALLFLFMSSRCAMDGCMEEAAYGRYCISHVCLEGGCEWSRSKNSSYCSYHQNLRDEAEAEAAAEAATSPLRDLRISDVSVSSGSSYVRASGTVTNRGSRTYTFIKVKGSFKNRSGEVVDTDWTYACGSEGLAPGETTSFQMSVPKKGNITDCSVTLLDCD